MGPKFVDQEAGEHAATGCKVYEEFVLPAYPADTRDPTCGRPSAGGMMGYIASQGTFSSDHARRAGRFMARSWQTHTISDFSLDGLEGSQS